MLHHHGSDSAERVEAASLGTNSWLITSGPLAPQVDVASLTGQPPDDYDVSGDGVVNRLDAEVVIYNLMHTERLWQNPSNRWDVNGDGYVVAGDVLIITNYVNAHGSRLLDQPRQPGDPYLDVTGDNVVSALDAQQVIDKINNVNGGNTTTAWRNGANPNDVTGDGIADASDATAIYNLLGISHTLLTDLALDHIHLRTHGGNDVLSGSYQCLQSRAICI